MKTIKVSRRSKGVQSLLKRALRENLVLRSPEGHEFILAEVHDFDREIELARQNRALMKFLNARARQTDTVSLEQARNRLGLQNCCSDSTRRALTTCVILRRASFPSGGTYFESCEGSLKK